MNPYTPYPCINCGQPVTKPRAQKPRLSLCLDCIRAEEALTAMLKEGITLEYSDGTSETLTLKEGDQ